MTLARRYNSALHLCVALGVLAFCIADDETLLALASAAAVAACLLLSGGRRVEHPPVLPRLAINVLVVAAIVHAAMRTVGGSPNGEPIVVSTLGQFLVFIVLLKLLDRRAPRDDAQLLTLAVFIAIAAMLTGSQFLVGVLLIAFVPSALGATMLWQLRTGEVMLARAGAGTASPSADGTGPGPRPATGRHARRGFVGLCAVSLIAACSIATAVFLLVPRLGGEFLGRFGVTNQAQMGFRDSVTLGHGGFLTEDPTPVLDVLVTNEAGENLGSTTLSLYLRGASRDTYDAGTRAWDESAPTHGEHKIDAGNRWFFPWRKAGASAEETTANRREVRIQKFTMRASPQYFFYLWRPVWLSPDRVSSVSFSRQTGSLRLTDAPGPRLAYTIESNLAPDLVPPPPAPAGFQSGRIREYTLRTLAGARSVPGDPAQRTPRQIATTIRDHLRTAFAYTTEMVAPPEGTDAIEFFLFDRKAGHCEYFASAMAAMCQSQGLPARVVTGYVATEFNTLTGQYTVRQSNAHAWVEVFIATDPVTGEGRWEQFDPSPPGDIERLHRPPGGLMARLRSWYDALEFGWSNSVIGFDSGSAHQSLSGRLPSEEELSPRLIALADRIGSLLKTIRSDPSQVRSLLTRWGLRALWISACFTAIFLVFRRTIGRGINRFVIARTQAENRAAFGLSAVKPPAFYARALKLLARAGVPKPDATPPARYARALEARSPAVGRSLGALAEMFYRVRFGGQPLSAEQAAEAEAQLRALSAAVREVRSSTTPG